MLRERRPLGALDHNKQITSEKRVQPARAAKTSHKWFAKKIDENGGSKDEIRDYGVSTAFKSFKTFDPNEDKENVCALRLGNPAKSKSENNDQKDHKIRHRIPLQALSVPAMKPFAHRKALESQNLIHPKESLLLSRLPHDASENSDNSMSVSLDTLSDSSLLDSESSNDLQYNDSAFFSCTQSSAPCFDSKELPHECESASLNHTKVLERRSTTKLYQNGDMMDEYFPDIIMNMRNAESKYRLRHNFMQQQPEVSSNMRTKLVDWLIEVQDEYKLEDETVALAVAYSDRFLSLMSVTRSKLQLLGTTAMFVAAKYEEIYPPDADEFAYLTADTYTKAEVILMERLLLRVLGSAMALPTTHQFLGLLLHNSNATARFRSLATYLTEITMLYDRYQNYSCSVLAAAAVCVACHLGTTKKKGQMNEKTLETAKGAGDQAKHTGYHCKLSRTVRFYMKDLHDEIYACTLELLESHRDIESAPQQFVREKYSSKKHFQVALIPSLFTVNDRDLQQYCHRDILLSMWKDK